MTKYKYIRIEKHLVTKVIKVKDMTEEQIEKRLCDNLKEGRYTLFTEVGDMRYNDFQVDTEVVGDIITNVDEWGENDGH